MFGSQVNLCLQRAIALAIVALACVAPQACAQTIAVTEFLNNDSGVDANEWVELFNYGPYSVTLSNWRIADEDTDDDPLPAIQIPSGGFAVVAENKSLFESTWLGGAASAQVIGVPGLTLANTSDEIILRNLDALPTQQWSLAYADDEVEGRATFLAIDDFSTTSYGSKASPGVVRSGNDVTLDLGYESNSATADPFAFAATTGDVGSPLAGGYSAAALPAVSPFAYALPSAGGETLIDFDDFDGAGFAPAPAAGQFDSDNVRILGLQDGDLLFGGAQSGNDFSRGLDDGQVTTGGVYAFNPLSPGDHSLGVQPTGNDFTPGSITFRLPNETGDVVDALDFSADLLVNNDQDRSTTIDVAYSLDDINYITFDSVTTPTDADALGFQTTSLFQSLTGLNIPGGGFLYLRFSADDALVPGSGSRDELAINNLRLFAPVSSAAPVPEPGSLALWTLLAVGFGAGAAVRRRWRS
ncbi:MAG: lamin tail domain-containing protein [Planctomycetales bacterium]|nr:lamin tail domain-containing protein [Planctomycetales bacterium]